MTTLLEQRYRFALRMLPAYYRARREDEMVDAYLDGIDESDQDEMRPSLGELGSVAALAVRTRIGGVGAPGRYATAGAAVRHFALLSVLLQAATELTVRVITLVGLDGASRKDRELFLSAFTGHGVLGGAYEVLMWAVPLCWVAVYAALLRDSRRAAKILAAVAALPVPLMTAVDWSIQGEPLIPPFAAASALFGWLTVLAVCCGFHSGAPAARFPVLPPGQALMATCVLMGLVSVAHPQGADEVTGTGWAFAVAAGLWLAALARRAKPAGDPAVPLALAAVGLAVLAERLTSLTILLEGGVRLLTQLAWVQAAVVAVLVAVLCVAALRLASGGGARNAVDARANSDGGESL